MPIPDKAIYFSCWCSAGVDIFEGSADLGNNRRAAVLRVPEELVREQDWK